MKNKFTYFLLLLLAFTAACSNKNTAPMPQPSGTFSGTFLRLHLNKNNTIDSAKVNTVLSLETTGYAVTSDTTTFQAGSHGSFIFGTNNFIEFLDVTYPATGIPAKTHLFGIYQYAFDGTNLQMFASTDSLGYQYILKRTGN